MDYLEVKPVEYDPHAGLFGRGTVVGFDRFNELAEELSADGWKRFEVPGKTNEQWVALYNPSGSVSTLVWAGFIKEMAGKHFCVALEVPVSDFPKYRS